jgi:hypothetical protein
LNQKGELEPQLDADKKPKRATRKFFVNLDPNQSKDPAFNEAIRASGAMRVNEAYSDPRTRCISW